MPQHLASMTLPNWVHAVSIAYAVQLFLQVFSASCEAYQLGWQNSLLSPIVRHGAARAKTSYNITQ